jgi:hypothetical protein
MAIKRQELWYSGQRLSISQLRTIESAAQADADTSWGSLWAGRKALIIKGFNITFTPGVIGGLASSLVLNSAGGGIVHYYASDSGSFLEVPKDHAPEVLSATNSKILGGFVANSSNYISLNLIRSVDTSTVSTYTFIDSLKDVEYNKDLPSARVYDYQIMISSVPFGSQQNACPVAIVFTDINNNVVSITDARQLAYRLGSGGNTPSATYSYPWTSRTENPVTADASHLTDPFVGGDKTIASFNEWSDAVKTRVWELGGGERWFAATADRNVRFTFGTVTFGAENIEFNGTGIRWSGITVRFDNSTATYNRIADSASSYTAFPAGSTLYVDVLRSVEGQLITPVINIGSAIGTPTIPGSRWVLAYRGQGSTSAFAWGINYTHYLGSGTSPGSVASTSQLGIIRTVNDNNTTTVVLSGVTDPIAPTILNDNMNTLNYLSAIASGLTRGETGAGLLAGGLNIGRGDYDNGLIIGKFTPSNPGGFITGSNNLTNDVKIYSRRVLLNSGAAGSSSLASTFNVEIDAEAGFPSGLVIGGTNVKTLTLGGGGGSSTTGKTMITSATTGSLGTTISSVGAAGLAGTVITSTAGNVLITATLGDIGIAPSVGNITMDTGVGTSAINIASTNTAQTVNITPALTVNVAGDHTGSADLQVQTRNVSKTLSTQDMIYVANGAGTTVARVDAAGNIRAGKEFLYINPDPYISICPAIDMVSANGTVAWSGAPGAVGAFTNASTLSAYDTTVQGGAWLSNNQVLALTGRIWVPAGATIGSGTCSTPSVNGTGSLFILVQSNAIASLNTQLYFTAWQDVGNYSNATTNYPYFGTSGMGFTRTYLTQNTGSANIPNVRDEIAYPSSDIPSAGPRWLFGSTGAMTLATGANGGYVNFLLIHPAASTTTFNVLAVGLAYNFPTVRPTT